jgi:hypothetical protein
MQCLNGVCSTGLTIDGPGVSIRAGRFYNPAPSGQFFERYRRGPFNWESYTRRGIGSGGFATTYGGVLGGGRGSFASFGMPAQDYAYPVASYPVVTYAAESIPIVTAPIYAAEQVPVQVLPYGQGGLLQRVAIIEQRIANVERILGP